MALPLITWAFKFEIHYVDKLVLVAIADDSDKAGVSRYLGSLKTIGRQCSLSDRQIRRSIRKLELWGLIKTYPQQRTNGSDTVHIFQCCSTIEPKEWNEKPPVGAKLKGIAVRKEDVSRSRIMSTFTRDFEEALRKKFGDQHFHTWLAPCRVISVEKGRLALRLPKVVFAEFLHDHQDKILSAAQQVEASISKLHLVIPEE